MSPIPHPAAAASGGKLIAPNLTAIAAEIVSHIGLVLVQAPAGYGKTVLTGLLTDAGFTPVNARGLAKNPVTEAEQVVIDDGCDLSGIQLDALAAGAAKTLVITGRCLSHLDDWADDHSVRRYTMRRLTLDVGDVQTVLGDEASAAVTSWVHSVSVGWPGLVVAMRADMTETGFTTQPDSSSSWFAVGTHVRRFTDRAIQKLSALQSSAFGQLSHFPSFPKESLVALISPEALSDVHRCGMPLHAAGRGMVRLPLPVTETLVADSGFRATTAKAVIPGMLTAVGLVDTASLLLNAGCPEDSAALLCSEPACRIDGQDLSKSVGLLRTLDQRLGSVRPDLLMRLARVHFSRAELVSQREVLIRARDRAAAIGDEVAVFEADLEVFFAEIAPGLQAEDKLLALKERATQIETTLASQVRLREAEANVLAQSSEQGDIRASRVLFLDVAAEWESLGEADRASYTLRTYMAVPCWEFFAVNDALAAAQQAMTVDPSRHCRTRVWVMSMRLASTGGNSEAFNEAEQRFSADIVDLPDWMLAYRSWSKMTMASYAQDRDAVAALHRAAAGLLGDLLDHFTGVTFLADSAESFAWVGDKTMAFTLLDRAVNRRSEARASVAVTELTVHATVGDASKVPALVADLATQPFFPSERAWQLDLAGYYATYRLTGAEPTASQTEVTLQQARTQGCEQAVVHRLAQMVTSKRSVRNPKVWLFGAFKSSTPITGGNNTLLLQYLAIAARPVRTERVIADLWPHETDMKALRKRLTNTVSRLRSDLGDRHVVREDDTLALVSVDTDLADFNQATRRAHVDGVAREALLAMEIYSDHLLAATAGEDWLDAARERFRRVALEALEVLTEEPPADLAADRLVAMAVLVGLAGNQSWTRITEHAVGQGSTSSARRARQHLKPDS